MNKYLEKIAKEQKEKKLGMGEGVAAGFGIHVGANMLEPIYNHGIIKAMDENPSMDKKTLRKILRDNKDLDVTFSRHKAYHKDTPSGKKMFENASGIGRGPHAEPKSFDHLVGKAMKRNYVHMGNLTGTGRIKNIDVALHEMGHLRQYHNRGKIATRAMSGAKLTSLLGTKAFGVGSMIGGGMLASDKNRKHAWMAPLAVAVPMLHDEGMANYHGYKMIAKHGTGAMKRKFLGLAAKNMMGYGGGAVVASGILHHIAKKMDEKGNKK